MNSTVEQAFELGKVSASLIGEDRAANRQRMSLLVKMTGNEVLWDYYYDGRARASGKSEPPSTVW